MTGTAGKILMRPNLQCSILAFFFTSLVVLSLIYYLSAEDGSNVRSSNVVSLEDESSFKNSSFPGGCNLFSGNWVYDDKSYPLYKEQECSFMAADFACEQFGRKEFKYQHWRWQPHYCDLPRFNATALLEKLRGKRVVFVGDSLSKNQWMSFVCLLESSIPDSQKKSNVWKGSLITFEAFEYNATVDFYWEPLLVESNCDDPINHHVVDRIIRVGAIEKHAKHWTDADIVVFSSFTWWLRPQMTILWGSFESSDGVYKKVEMKNRRYELALRTWSDWVEMQVNRTKTKLFFMSSSPYHKIMEDWGMSGEENCYDETEPTNSEETEYKYGGIPTDVGMMRIAEAAMDELRSRGLRVEYLNITQLSDYRKDAHPSIYRKQWINLTEEQLSNPKSYADCVHWCLPGVPDVWNHILYAYVMSQS